MATSPSLPERAAAAVPIATEILAGAAILALLYFAREVLVPVTLAGILSLLLAPLVRLFRRVGCGHVSGVLGAVGMATLVLLGLAAMIVSQAMALANNLPQYELTMRAKLRVVERATVGRMEAMQGEAGKVIGQLGDEANAATDRRERVTQLPVTTTGAVPVEIRERPASPLRLMGQAVSSIWGPLGTAGIVLVVLIFALLEHESLRDRFIRLAGDRDLRGTTHAFNDASERLSRYFVSQFAVNVGVGAVVGLGLAVLGVPQALLWAVLTAALRFVPYVGVFVAAFSAALLAAAADPGWAMALTTLGLFAAVELVAAQAIEPFLYGHSTGLSPLSVVVAAIFWSWIWGPIGLLLSTPLTLCLVVAGRHVRALAFLDILLGDAPALTLAQRFYQRALSGDADEILSDAREYLRRRTFARYCDAVVMPALRLAGVDLASGSISPDQQQRVRSVIATVIESLGPDPSRRRRRRVQVSVLDGNSVGRELRHRREDAMGRWQGPLDVPPGSVTLCISLGSQRDDLVTEILVRILRGLGSDARHLSEEDMQHPPPPGAKAASVATVYIVTAIAAEEWLRAAELARLLRTRYPGATLVGLLPAHLLTDAQAAAFDTSVDLVVHDFESAAERGRPRETAANTGTSRARNVAA